MEEPDDVNYPIHVELAISINQNNYNGLTDAIEILLDEIADYAYTHNSMPIHLIQFGFWYYNSTCLLCHSNIANPDVNPRKKGPLILMINFQFLAADESDFLTLLEDIYNEWKDDNINTLPHFGKYIPSFMKSDVLDMMRPRINEFRQLRLEAGLDSIDLFTNDYLDEIIFYDVDRPSGNTHNDATIVKSTERLHISFITMLVIMMNK